jgi:hypothetical protein
MHTHTDFLDHAREGIELAGAEDYSLRVNCYPGNLKDLQAKYANEVVCILEVATTIDSISHKIELVCLQGMQLNLVRDHFHREVSVLLQRAYTKALAEHVRGSNGVDTFKEIE